MIEVGPRMIDDLNDRNSYLDHTNIVHIRCNICIERIGFREMREETATNVSSVSRQYTGSHRLRDDTYDVISAMTQKRKQNSDVIAAYGLVSKDVSLDLIVLRNPLYDTSRHRIVTLMAAPHDSVTWDVFLNVCSCDWRRRSTKEWSWQ